ncbi:NIPSNAP family protein [Acidisoma cellulosilytica]|uniref:NIPSNAP family protein n=1 Tax=Acidisoma cellulosilyticum TaxID=2802395 RepID=A0A963YXA7_9PROT|nr:NIPSNAP family protein [Acidisoma cellulosilyticum]MCB8878863.1 NIPSNAP family protein [Acidisoma cellulosilyticum]
MLIDHRTYTTRPGRLQQQLKLYAEHGFPVQRRLAGDPLAFLVTESGPLNSYVHLWMYRDAGHRAEVRAALQADPEWAAYMARSAEAGNLVAQENRLMVPATFFPLPSTK